MSRESFVLARISYTGSRPFWSSGPCAPRLYVPAADRPACWVSDTHSEMRGGSAASDIRAALIRSGFAVPYTAGMP